MDIIQKTQRVSDEMTPTIEFIGRCVRACVRQPKRVLIALVIIAALAMLAYFTLGNKTHEEMAQQELAAAIAAVGQLMILPEGDEPVLATVTDAEALIKQQAFFAGAVNGDQLLLFPKSLKAVIYSPSRNKIINAGPIEQQPQAAAAKSEILNSKSETNLNIQNSNIQNTLTIEVRNGTGRNGWAVEVAEKIRAAGFTVVAVADAKNKKYSKTVAFSRKKVESLAPLEASLLTGLAAQIGAEFITELSGGEKSTEADALIILGGE